MRGVEYMCFKINEDLKRLMKEKGVTQIDLAIALGVSDTTVYRMLRKPLTDEKKEELIKLINKLGGAE